MEDQNKKMTFDLIFNWLMPILIVVFFVGIFYVKLKEPTDMLFGWIGGGLKSLIISGKEKATESIEMSNEIVFE